MINSFEIVGGVIAILLALYSWVKKPVEDLKGIIKVHEEKHIVHKEEITRLRDGLHSTRNTLQSHESRITHLEEKETDE